MPELRGRDDRGYRKDNARLRKQSAICWLCGEEIDRTLPPTHPMSWTADHIEPLASGGELMGKRLPAHRRCNSSRGVGAKPKLKTTREW